MKTMYRIELAEYRNKLAEEVAQLACLFNGGNNFYSIEFLTAYCRVRGQRYPEYLADTIVEMIGDNTLHIDRKIGEHYVTVLAINLVEVGELKTIEQILKEEASENVTLQRHLSQQGEQC